VRGPVLAVLLAAGLGSTGIPAAGQALDGVALGPDGSALDGVPVVLHRVGGGGGAFVATETTDPEGRFRFLLESADSAVYFAALRYEGRMYIGPAVQGGGAEPITDYLLRVEPGAEAGAVASALSGNAPTPPAALPAGRGAADSSDTGALLLVGLLALTAAAIFLLAAPRYRRQRTRDALIELAELENRLAGDDVEDRARLEAERDRQRERLAPRS
jgi:hypothetical protein